MEAGTDKSTSKADVGLIRVTIANYNAKTAKDITPLVHSFNIYENINGPYATCDVVLKDATSLLDTLPMIGEETLIINYATRGLKADPADTHFKKRERAFRVYKISDTQEASEKQLNYKLHGIDDHYHVNEGFDINTSFVGQNCIKAASQVFKSYFTKANITFRPFDKQEKLFGKGKDDVLESSNASHFVSPGLTPIEVIKTLMGEAEHKEVTNPSDYVLYQDVDGIHLTTISELKQQEPAFTYYLKDPNTEEYENVREGELVKDKILGTEMNEVVLFQQFKNFDHGTNIKQGFYGNRVVAIDVLTKRYDERIETYGSQFRNLSPMENGALISTGEHPKGFLSRIGSTHTRYLATELLTTSLDTGNPSSFSTGSIASYSLHPYIYPVGVKGADKDKDKIDGTLKNEEARKKQADVVSKDSKVAYPRRRHRVLNRRVMSRAVLNNIMFDVMVPGNSDMTVGQVINIFFPKRDDPKPGKYNDLYCGKEEAKFLIIHLNHVYAQDSSGYYTKMTVVKDSYSKPIDKVFELNNQGVESE